MKVKVFKESFKKPANKIVKESVEDDIKKLQSDSEQTIARAEDYWKNEVYFQLENIEDLSQDERILNASEEQIEAMASDIAKEILDDEHLWGEINDTIEYYIYHHDYMLGAKKKEPVKESESPEEKRTGHTEGKRLPELK